MARSILYDKLKPIIESLSDDQLETEIKKNHISKGWGINSIITIDNTKIFVKVLPVTQKEYNNQYNTSNLYNLPTFYSYGVGSAGFNCWREVSTHIKTTEWVKKGLIENFPLMYHYRIVSNKNKPKKVNDHDYDDYVIKWNNDNNIKQYMLDKDNAPYNIIMCLEHIPNVLEVWLTDDKTKIRMYNEQSNKIINFLKNNNMIHFDSHLGNMLTDDKIIYLTDFGLLLDKQFTLSDEELVFFDKNDYYDYARCYFNMFIHMINMIENKKNEDYLNTNYGFDKCESTTEIIRKTYDNINPIFKYLKMSDEYKDYLLQIKSIVLMYNSFYETMKKNNKKDTMFPNDIIKRFVNKHVNLEGGSNYYQKYQKYKYKYLHLQQKQTGNGPAYKYLYPHV